jgi:hypothetical protein
VSVNVPLKGPLYCPVQDPERLTAAGIGVGVGVGTAVGVLVATGALVAGTAAVGVGVVVVDALQAASSDSSGSAVNIRMIRFTSRVLQCSSRYWR